MWLSRSVVSSSASLPFFWPWSWGMRWLLQFLGSYLGLKQKEEGKEVVLVWFCFCNWRASDPPEVPIRYYLYLIGQYQVTWCHQARWIENRTVTTVLNLSWSITGWMVHCHPRQNWGFVTRSNRGRVTCHIPQSCLHLNPSQGQRCQSLLLEPLGWESERGPRWEGSRRLRDPENDNSSPHDWIGGSTMID